METQSIDLIVFSFKHTHYHKQPLQKELKETKDCRDAFKSIQIPYRKAVENINKVKKVKLVTLDL